MRLIFGTLTALTLGAASAVAADLPARMPVKAPVMAPVVYNWTGFYAGANAGYSWGRDPVDLSTTSTTRNRVFRAFGLPAETLISDVTAVGAAAGASSNANVDGWLAGGQIGYNWQVSSWVVGLETDFQWTGQKGGAQFCLTAGCPAGSFITTADYKLQWFGTARARAGFLVDPRVLLYVTGGLAYGEVKADYTSGTIGLPLTAASASSTRVGWTIGGGVEGVLTGNWTVKAEYLYMDLGTIAGVGSSTTGTVITPNSPTQGFTTVTDTTISQSTSSRIHDNIFRVGVNYRFAPEPIVARY
jgi:outer membrane immunogenic protein